MSHLAVHLGGHDDFLAGEELADKAPGGHLARSAGVHVSSVEKGDAALDGQLDDRLRGVLVEDPRPVAVVPVTHHPEANPGDPQAALAQAYVLHRHLRLGLAPGPDVTRSATISATGWDRPGPGPAGTPVAGAAGAVPAG